MRKLIVTSVALCAAALATQAIAQAPPAPAAAPPPAYGEMINLEQAKKAAAAAQEFAAKNGWAMAISVAAPSGDLVYFQKMDNTQFASIAISQHKARASATYRRETKAFEAGIQGGANYLITLDDIIASRGGIPLVEGGKLIGAIGCSGGTGSQDEVVCKAGAATVNK